MKKSEQVFQHMASEQKPITVTMVVKHLGFNEKIRTGISTVASE